MQTLQHSRIVTDTQIMVGKPVNRGTRITVESMLRKLAAGWNVEKIIEAHPHLTPDDIHAALAYAADELSNITVSA
ncbi:MAG: DUF433 domain-containing protein [Chloroflexota bacterium]|nr:DUF433 domain-containing protein [Chloroflexota bacterium]